MSFKEMGTIVFLVLFCIVNCLEGFTVKRDAESSKEDEIIKARLNTIGELIFISTVSPLATQHRKIACFFVFDKIASADLKNNLEYGKIYADRLAAAASQYTAHANIEVINAGVEMWTNNDRIPFTSGVDPESRLPNAVPQFQKYLNDTHRDGFGTKYAIGVLLTNKSLGASGVSQGPPCTTYGVSLISYGSYPWAKGGLLAHELAHTLSVIHPNQLTYLCSFYSELSFCQKPTLLAECQCTTKPSQCLMTNQFGLAEKNAAKYTACDIEMMNYFSSDISCLIK